MLRIATHNNYSHYVQYWSFCLACSTGFTTFCCNFLTRREAAEPAANRATTIRRYHKFATSSYSVVGTSTGR